MRRNYNKYLFGLSTFFAVFLNTLSFGQCSIGPYAGIGVANAGTSFATWANYSPGTYLAWPVLAGGSYGISTCGAPIDTQVSGFNPSLNLYFYNDDNGPICGGTAASADNIVPNFTNYMYVQVSQYNCLPGGTSSINVSFRQNNNLAFTSLSTPMCSGDTRVLTASPANVGASPGGFGNPGSFSGTGVAGNVFTAPVVGVPTVYTITYTFGYVSQTQNITVNPRPTMGSTTTAGTICFGQSTTLNGTGANTYTWTGGVTNGVAFTPGSTTTYTVTGTSAAGCISTVPGTRVITVNPLPVVGSTTSNSVICLGQTTTLNGTNANTYTWTGGVTNGVAFNPGGAGTYNYTVNGTDAAGCTSTNSAVRSITVNALPVVGGSATPTVVCFGGLTTLNGSGATTYTWSGGATNGVPIAPPATTNYTVTGTLASTGCTNTAVRQVSVNPLPPIGSTTTNSVICFGQGTSLNGTGGTTYTWSGGVTNAVTFSPAATATYVVTGTLASTGCTNTASRTITVNPLPIVGSTTTNSVICFGQNTTLNGTGASTYTWTGGVTNGVGFNPGVAGTYNYTVNGTDAAGCTSTNSAVRSITVNPLPVVGASATNTVFCFGGSTTFNGSGASTYTWSGGATNAVAFTPGASGTPNYTVNGTDAAGCTSTNSAVQTITVIALPVVVANTSTASVCLGNFVTLTGSAADTYTWTGGVTNGVAFAPTVTTTYSVNGTNTLTGCTSTNTPFQTIVVNPLPVVTANISSSVICDGVSVIVNGGGAATYTWTSGVTDGVPFTPTTSGSYSVTGTSAIGCLSSNTAVTSVTVNPLPNVIAGTSLPAYCDGGTTTLVVGGADTYTWNPGALTGASTTVSPGVGVTIYTVTGTNSLTGCQNTSTVGITVHPLPTVTAVASPTAICEASTASNVVVTAIGASTYSYSNMFSPAVFNALPGLGPWAFTTPSLTASGTTLETYYLGVSAFGCLSAIPYTLQVPVHPRPSISSSVSSNVICFGNSVTVNGQGADTYVWTNSVTDGVPFFPSITNVYDVVGTFTLTGCTSTNSAAQTITVNPLPAVSASTSSASICLGFSTMLNASNAQTYTWNPGNLVGASISVTPAITTSYTLVGTSTAGCTSTNVAIQTITVNSIPIVSVSASSPTICFGATSTLTASGAGTYTWLPGSSNGSLFSVTPPATQNYSVTGTSPEGCLSSNTATLSITVNTLPIVGSTVSNSVICFGATTSVNGTGADTYIWTGGITNGVAFNPTLTATYNVSGTNSLTGCTSTNVAAQTITVNQLPVVALTSPTPAICLGFTTALAGSTSGTVAAQNYTFASSTLTLPVSFPTTTAMITPTASTSYTLVGISAAGCTSTNNPAFTVTVNPLPLITSSASNPTVCFGQNSILTGTGAATYTWNPGGIIGSPITVTPGATQVYSVTGRSAFGCLSSNTSTLSVTVNTLPIVVLTVTNPVICFGNTSTISSTGANTYTWNPGNLNGSNIFVTPAITTNYTVTGTNALTGCTSTNVAAQTITVNQLPVVAASSPSLTICDGFSTSLIASNAQSYIWNPGGLPGATVVVSPTITTTYSLVGTSSAACTSTNLATVTITVNPIPNVTASTSSAVICSGGTTSILASGANTYVWLPGPLSGSNIVVTPASSTVYSLTGTTAAGCTSTNAAVVSITVNTLPLVTANSNSPSICLGFSTSLFGGGANTYTWTGGVSNNVLFAPISSNSYTVVGTDINLCQNSATITITVNPIPTVSANSSSSVICVGGTVSLTGGGASTYNWTGGAGGITDGTPFSPASTAVYSVSGTSTAGCVSANTATIQVVVNPLPVVTASASSAEFCIGNSTTLQGSGATNYSWTGGISDGVAFTPSVSQIYTVTGTDANSCQNTAVVSITVNQLPILVITKSNLVTPFCEGEVNTLSVNGANTYTWNTTPVNNSASFTIQPLVTTTYSVIGTDLKGCISSTSVVQTVTLCAPTITAAADGTDVTCNLRNDGKIEVVPIVLISPSATSPYNIQYNWTPSPNNCIANCQTITNLPEGTYNCEMVVTYTLGGVIVRSATVNISKVILDANPPCEVTVFNGVTPDGDGNNDTWQIENIQYYPNNRVTVYTRWGEELYDQKGYDNSTYVWPSKSEADKLISSTYFYIIDLGDGSKARKGWVEVMKK